jgi:predicted dehydrogenase
MRTYRVGIIGCGPRAHHHADALRHMPEVEIAGAVDPQADRLEAFCAKWEISDAYASAAQLLTEQRLDAATIATLPGPHVDLVVECATAGVAFINVEKPIAYRLSDLDRMLNACAAFGNLLTVNQQMRFMEQFIAVRDLVRSGRLGEVRFLRAGSKGHLTEQGPHTVDQMLFMNDDQPAEWVLGQADGAEGFDLKHRAPSTTAASIHFANGARGFIENGIEAPEVDPNGGFWLQKFVEVTGTKGWAGAYVNNGWRAVLDSGEVLSGPGTWEPNWIPQSALFRRGLEWTEDRSIEHPNRGEVARKGLETLLAICQSAVDGAATRLPLDPERDVLTELETKLRPH